MMLFILSLRQLCWTVALRSNVPREMLSVILLRSINNKACLQKTMPADDSTFVC